MADEAAKKLLRKILRSYTAGSVLHLLSELMREAAKASLRKEDHRLHEQMRLVEATLLVVGMGIDGASPR